MIIKIVAFLVFTLILQWENAVLYPVVLPFWQWFWISLAYVIAVKLFKPLGWLSGCACAIAVMGQMLYWLGLVWLPLSHYIRP